MKILIIEKTSEGQAALARKVESLDRVDRDTLDISVSLSDDRTFHERLEGVDVAIFGASLGDNARLLARRAKTISPSTEIIIFVTSEAYARGAFRSAIGSGARKVLSEAAPLYDLLQELMSIQEDFRVKGRIRTGRLVAVTQAKGGVGATSVCAALAEVCSEHGERTMLWDFDIETRDLCRALGAQGDKAKLISEWLAGTADLTRESFREALISVGPTVSMLPPPDSIAACVELFGQVDRINIVQAIADLARVTHRGIIADTTGRIGPATGAVLRMADVVLVVVDDSVLGLTGAHYFMSTLRSVVRNMESVCFLCSGITVPKSEIKARIEREYRFGEHAWRLPALPFDSSAARWPGSGSTLYGLGKRQTKQTLEQIASELGIADIERPEPVLALPYLDGAAPVVKSNGVPRERATEGIFNPFRSLFQRMGLWPA